MKNNILEKAFNELLMNGVKIESNDYPIIKKILEVLYYRAKLEESNKFMEILDIK